MKRKCPSGFKAYGFGIGLGFHGLGIGFYGLGLISLTEINSKPRSFNTNLEFNFPGVYSKS